ncbi:hypothetical protein LTR10_024129 [Elasticomyces elasticus]|uniref:3-hydroxybutyrate dehydrogenase n=1 Tax=Exophiala sideris TaxID=1016849 RepID=A0ABR0JKT6_9EURO|nr:hypothetical protein LTR10_024129 [Elasticomyces elasticus]KAK5032229.1 hypothetical protein LTR13_007446 [Exophiala sideris]KAK5036227.1 hypothetical protein LTS07_001952 [Exophiala sideris]KAK5066610.1 hypothetical protein LTR69_001956 [Exophiala sideris]KAK5180432.1 hypothetical protein LTR44_007189 [Eurotiomycetes sp. CCFEE 6388]
MAQQVEGKTAIVTGAGSGINLEFARLLLQHGANVVFADLALRPEAEDLVKQYPKKAVFQKTDVTSWADLNDMFKAAVDHFGSIDIVCPGAGVFEPHWSNFWYPPGSEKSQDDPLSGRYKLLDINLTHPVRVTQMAISHFLAASPPSSASNPKSIVHIASVAGQGVSFPFPLYHASKHGIQALVRCMASLEQLHGIRVTCVEPGVVKTPLWTDHPEKLKIVKEEKDVWVTPEEVAEVMLACVKDDEIPAGKNSKEGEDAKVPIKGGSCIEVLAGSVRDVPLWNNAGPYAKPRPGLMVSDTQKIIDEVEGVLKPGWGKI